MSRPGAQAALRRLSLLPHSASLPLTARQPHPKPIAAGPSRSRRYASSPSIRGSASTPMPMPPDMPREDYAAPTLYTLSYLSRIIRLILYSALGLGAAGLTGFEGLHLYIEHRLMSTPASSSSPGAGADAGSGDNDGWAGENTSWTGRERGGTDPRLGWKARHALRGAWICQEWGAGGPAGSIGRKNDVHGSGPALRSVGAGAGVEVNRVDRGYELADEYIDLAIREAKKRGLVFPDAAGSTEAVGQGKVDPTAVDLLLLKAGVLERLASPQSLLQAKGIYQDVLAHTDDVARGVRLSGKIGDLAQRTGGEGSVWWMSGLQRAGIDLGAGLANAPVAPQLAAEEKRGWFGRRSKTTSEALASTSTIAASTLPTPSLPPAVLRAAIGVLISTEAHLATTAQYAEAARIQDLALSLLPARSPGELQDTWTSHRRALLTLHSASVAHAQKQPASALDKATSAASLAEIVIPSVPSYPISSAMHPSAKLLERDAHTLAAESNYTRGLLLEKTGAAADLDAAGECFEKAMSMGERGVAWDRYYKAFARVREKLEKRREAVRGNGV